MIYLIYIPDNIKCKFPIIPLGKYPVTFYSPTSDIYFFSPTRMLKS